MLDIISEWEREKNLREGFYILDTASCELVDGPFPDQDEAVQAIKDGEGAGDLFVIPLFLPVDNKGRKLDLNFQRIDEG